MLIARNRYKGCTISYILIIFNFPFPNFHLWILREKVEIVAVFHKR
jgi:hypothetical protein